MLIPPSRGVVSLGDMALSIRRNPDGSTHVGIIYKEKSDYFQLHLLFHQNLSVNPPNRRDGYVKVNIEKERLRPVAALCRKLSRSKPAIPFALSGWESVFEVKSGHLILRGNAVGLTCSSFVMAVFLSVGISLIDFGKWPNREDDEPNQNRLVSLLEKVKANPSHINAVRAQIGCVRIKPEEVAVSVQSPTLPADYGWTSEMAKNLLIELDCDYLLNYPFMPS